jgi:hypothetical protein
VSAHALRDAVWLMAREHERVADRRPNRKILDCTLFLPTISSIY